LESHTTIALATFDATRPNGYGCYFFEVTNLIFSTPGAFRQTALLPALLASCFGHNCLAQSTTEQRTEKKGRELIVEQAEQLKPLFSSEVARSFLESARQLPKISEREVLVDPEDRQAAISLDAAEKLTPEERARYESRKLDEHFYYFTRYGSPLAFARPLEIAANKAGIQNVAGLRIVDFGFGSIGQLRMLASQGADVTGIEVDLLLTALYSQPSDVGAIRVASADASGADGKLELLFGKFPVELDDKVRDGVDLFVSKNTLKRGYIHPEKPVNPKMLVQLGVSDEQFLRRVHAKLNDDGHFLIYNLHPAPAADDEPYIPWADGRSPFSRAAFVDAGFEVLEFDVDDTPTARQMAKALKWDAQMDLENDLFATYTLVKKALVKKAQQPEIDQTAVFDEVAGIVAEHFYDKQFDVDAWQLKVEEYRPRAVAATTRDQFAETINELLSSLNTSHTRYFSSNEPRRYQLLGVFSELYGLDQEDLFVYDGIGIETKKIADEVYVSAVFDGLPADQAGLLFGDQILAVDGMPFHPIRSFAGKVGAPVAMKIRRRGREQSVTVTVGELDGRTMFETALAASQQVFEKNGKRIGYLHVWSYAGSKYQELIRSAILWDDLSQCDALILDLRNGWGGADVNYLNLFRKPILNVESTSRSGQPRNYSGVWGKPVALLTNGGSTSGKELFAFGFKKLKLGKIFGETTAGAVVAGRCFLLGNRDVLYLAVNDVHVDGLRLEGRGVDSDFPIARPLRDAESGDRQLEGAIEYLSNLGPDEK
jgi:carboxyl-terminal processing protease